MGHPHDFFLQRTIKKFESQGEFGKSHVDETKMERRDVFGLRVCLQ
jgi:hypothetical protein